MRKVIQVTTRHMPSDTRIYRKYCLTLLEKFPLEYLSVKKAEKKLKVNHKVINSKFKIFSRLLMEKNVAIHFHDPDFIIYAFLLSIFTNNKVIYDVHEDAPLDIQYKVWIPKVIRYPLSFIFGILEKNLSRSFSGITTATDFIRNKFVKFNSNVATIHNYPITKTEENIYPWKDKNDQYCYVGSIAKFRSIYQIINVTDKKGQLKLAGSFTNEGLKKDIESLSNWKNVDYLGFINTQERNKLLDKSKIGLIILQPIKTFLDAIPVKLFEYMERGIPVIASNFKINEDFVTQNKCGLLIDPENELELKEGIKYLLENQEVAKKMGENGRKAVLEKYNWEKESQKLISFYNKI